MFLFTAKCTNLVPLPCAHVRYDTLVWPQRLSCFFFLLLLFGRKKTWSPGLKVVDRWALATILASAFLRMAVAACVLNLLWSNSESGMSLRTRSPPSYDS